MTVINKESTISYILRHTNETDDAFSYIAEWVFKCLLIKPIVELLVFIYN